MDVLRKDGIVALLRRTGRYLKYRFPRLQSTEYAYSIVWYYTYRLLHGESAPHPYKLVRVDAVDIKYWVDQTVRSKIDFRPSGTTVIGGDWDQKFLKEERTKTRFRKLDRALHQRFNKGIPWEKTAIYEYAIEASNPNKLYTPGSDLDERIEQLDELYDRLHKGSYRTQRELQDEDLLSDRTCEEIPAGHPPEVHEIGVAITRNGEFAWFYGGNHRLHLAKLLGLENIPVRVVVRHSDWQEIRTRVEAASSMKELSSGTIPNKYFSHPDLQSLLPDSAC